MEPSWSVPSRPAPRRRPHRGERHRAGGAWTRARTFLEPSWSLLGASRQVDASLGLGVAFTAHPREDRKRGRVVGWSWAAPLVGSSLSVTVHEWDAASGALLASTPTALPSAIAPHDFALTDSWHADSAASRQESEGGRLSLSTPPPRPGRYIFALNAMQLNLFPYVLGLTGPVGALRTTGEGGPPRAQPSPPPRRVVATGRRCAGRRSPRARPSAGRRCGVARAAHGAGRG